MMKNNLLIKFILFISVIALSSCVKEKAEALVKENFLAVTPETFFNINFNPRGNLLMVNFPSDNRIGYVQLIVKDYEPNKPQKLKFYNSEILIQKEIDVVCRIYNISQKELLPFIHNKVTSYHKSGASLVKGINSKPYIVFQYGEDVILYYIKDLPQSNLESFIAENNLQILNKSWLYKRYESDILN